jgi:hypothetical protein
MFNDNTPSDEVEELGRDIGTQVNPKSKRVKTRHSFCNVNTCVLVGVTVGVAVTEGVTTLVELTVGVIVLVGVAVVVGVGVGVGQVTDAGTFNFTTPFDGLV